ncbi:hypothetical protein B0A50_00089 [Salinomyces thailandicus]|uniref:ATP synthase assembly factor FMC1, mitochondrial n=1 Tax=Salinomyces thailandicus TaxID=706561 RepID=A0A4V5N7W1_9PEZI|nr:hypothetical protein B0A50_00089 [Salinomyces thailandica]
MASQTLQARSLYRRFLRELPSRSPSILANPSPIQQHIRSDFASTAPSTSSPSLAQQAQKSPSKRLDEAQQYLHYLRAQREYITLLERYNPGMNMNDEERVRLSARRVGMNLPIEVLKGGDGEKGE